MGTFSLVAWHCLFSFYPFSLHFSIDPREKTHREEEREGEGKSIRVLSASPSISPFLPSYLIPPPLISLTLTLVNIKELSLTVGEKKRRESSHSTMLNILFLPNQTIPPLSFLASFSASSLLTLSLSLAASPQRARDKKETETELNPRHRFFLFCSYPYHIYPFSNKENIEHKTRSRYSRSWRKARSVGQSTLLGRPLHRSWRKQKNKRQKRK